MIVTRTRAMATGRWWLVALMLTGLVLTTGRAWAAYYANNGDGTVTDTLTGLMWQQQDTNQARTWEGAITYCNGLDLAGFADWWLPDSLELASITDDSLSLPAIDTTAFPSADSSSYWSSSSATFQYGSNNAWNVNFSDGGLYYSPKTDRYYVRCVRSDSAAWPLAPLVGVLGTVTDSAGLPLAGVSVSTATGAITLSDDQGHYNLTLAAGTVTVAFSKTGYEPVSRSVTVQAGQVRTMDVTCFLIGTICGLPASLTVPASVPGGLPLTVSWDRSPTDGVTYILQQSTSANFSPVAKAYSGPNLSVTLSGLAAGTTYYYRVRATKAGMSTSSWQQGANQGCKVLLKVTIPGSITVPASVAAGNSFVVKWGKSPTPDPDQTIVYTLQEATTVNFSSPIKVYRGTGLSFTLNGRTLGKTYYYRVKATKFGMTPSAWQTGANKGCVVTSIFDPPPTPN